MKKTGMNFDMKQVLKASIIGALISLIITLLLSGVAALFINNEYIDIISARIISLTIAFIAVTIGAIGGECLTDNKRNLVCVLVGLMDCLLGLCIGMLFFEGTSSGVLANLIITIISVAVAVLVGNIKRKSKRNKVRKIRSR